MKKTVKTEKLKLNRETLRNLTESDLQGAVGGGSLQNSCDTATFRCGTMQSNCC